MFRCNVSFMKILILLLFFPVIILRLTTFAQTEQIPVDRDIPKIQEDQREEQSTTPEHGMDSKQELLITENDSIPDITGDSSFDSLETVLSSDRPAIEEPVMAKKEFLFTNLDMQVTALSFIMWVLMMCWAAFSS